MHLPRAARLLGVLLVTSCVLAAPTDENIDLDELLSSVDSSHLPVQIRSERQADAGDPKDEGDPNCSFGSSGRPTLCDYSNPNMSALTWSESTGVNSNWLGGPRTDADEAEDGGYAFFETSSMPTDPDGPNTESAMLESPMMGSTGPNGKCLKFDHSMKGLSVDRLRVLLHPVSEEEKDDGTTADHRDDIVIWSSSNSGGGSWKAAQQLYTYGMDHTIVFEAIPLKGQEREYRGHIAIDSVQLAEGTECGGHCKFDGDLCGWSQDTDDDFQWSRGRGTTNPKTGPMRDHGSSVIGGSAGGYVFIDSAYPRGPGDRARLISRRLAATSQTGPMCFRFWTHMHGPGVGTLRVLRMVGNDEKELWKLSGSSGNQWYQGQVPVTASDQFSIVIEAEVGLERLGDIAVDDVSLTPGVCPSAPQAASPDSSDCTFEVDECGWTNPGRREGVDRIDWRRITGRDAEVPRTDHTMRSERGYLLQLPYAAPQRAGDFAWLVSPAMKGREEARCLTFRYYMDATIPSSKGPQVGSIRVLVEYTNSDDELMRTPLWMVRNAQDVLWKYGQTTVDVREKHKIIFEGTWGGSTKGAIALDDITFTDGACAQKPPFSTVSASDCDFTRDACGWRNTTTDQDSTQRWRLATLGRKPSNLDDHTLNTMQGYVYFDAFNNNNEPLTLRLISPALEPRGDERFLCVAFWYAALSRAPTATLNVVRQMVPAEGQEPSGDDDRVVWSLTAKQTDEPAVTWRHGEVQVDASDRVRVVFEGRATDFGFALDDISLRAGSCRTRPPEANPARRDQENDTANKAEEV
ncbi:MAM and LDL-receptor class A domain-containing protein 2-like [Pollicipes pollicipes]|uniref:MAM and LDL-receptor class A domain-containing protein 2-like n=1 Tax=Pollicipes pollicipes TaxID=41117 RepID=UPI001884CDA1|nr:MAM and LDL-receptor class A domain-containing protein 2-like [Pollicipes pollicipes]